RRDHGRPRLRGNTIVRSAKTYRVTSHGPMTTVESTRPIRTMFVHEMSASTEIAEISPRQAAMMDRSRANRRCLLHATARPSSIGPHPEARASGQVVPTPKRTTADSASRAVAAAAQVIRPCRALSPDCACSLSTMHTVDERRRSSDHPARRDAWDRGAGRTSVDPEDYSELIAALAPARRTEVVAAPEAIGRTVSAGIVAVRPVPAFPTS